MTARRNVWAVAEGGLVRLTLEDDRADGVLVRPDERMQTMALDPHRTATIYVGGRGSGVCKSTNDGETWDRLSLPESDVFSLAVSAADGSVYAGTEPSKLFKSVDGGASWKEMTALTRLPSAPDWSFPPRPWTSHVRAIAPHPVEAGLLLVGIELGGVMRSEDGGETWADHRPGAQKDCHALAWHAAESDRAFETGGGGPAWSVDRGRTWTSADAGLDRRYTWALAVDPDEPRTWFISAAPGPRQAHSDGDARAGIFRWTEGGPWEELAVEPAQPLESMPYALCFVGRRLLAGLRDGRLFGSDDGGNRWRPVSVSGASLRDVKVLCAA